MIRFIVDRNLTKLRSVVFIVIVLFAVLGLIFPVNAQLSPSLGKSDFQALQDIYQQSSWTFEQSAINVEVHENGAIKLALIGNTMRKTADGSNSLLVPIALLEDIPLYYGVYGQNSNQTKLIAYKVEGGLWSVVALVKQPEAQSNKKETVGDIVDQKSYPFNLNILMIAPNFTRSLPLLIPGGTNISSIDASITLPVGAKFTSRTIRAFAKPFWAYLAVVPPSLAQGKIQGIARLNSELPAVWDFSDIAYQLPSNQLPSKSFSLSSLPFVIRIYAVLFLITIAVWLVLQVFLKERERGRQKRIERIALQAIVDGRAESEAWARARLEIDQYDYRQVYRRNPIPRYYSLRLLQRLSSLFILLSIFIFFFLLLALVVSGQPKLPTSNTPIPNSKSVFLTNYRLSVEAPKVYESNLKILFSFVPLSSKSMFKGTNEIFIKIGSDNSIINKIKAEPEDLVNKKLLEVIRYSANTSIIKVPLTSNTGLEELNFFAQRPWIKIIDVSPFKAYQEAVQKGQIVNLIYELSDAIEENNKWFGWLYAYPLERITVDLPIEIAVPAFVSNIQTKEPDGFWGKITVSGINQNTLTPSSSNRIVMSAGQAITVKGILKRYWTEWLLFPVGLMLGAGLIGMLCGWVAANTIDPTTSPVTWTGKLLEAFKVVIAGGSGLGVLIAIWLSIRGGHDYIPTIQAGTITVFDLFFLISFFMLIATFFLMLFKRPGCLALGVIVFFPCVAFLGLMGWRLAY